MERVAADQLKQKLAGYDYEGFVTVQTKSCGLAQAISSEFPRYLELRKSRKSFMVEPKGIKVKSITTHGEPGALDRQRKICRLPG